MCDPDGGGRRRTQTLNREISADGRLVTAEVPVRWPKAATRFAELAIFEAADPVEACASARAAEALTRARIAAVNADRFAYQPR